MDEGRGTSRRKVANAKMDVVLRIKAQKAVTHEGAQCELCRRALHKVVYSRFIPGAHGEYGCRSCHWPRWWRRWISLFSACFHFSAKARAKHCEGQESVEVRRDVTLRADRVSRTLTRCVPVERQRETGPHVLEIPLL